MCLRKCRKSRAGVDYVYWQLVESRRTERGPRQHVVASLGDLDAAVRRGVADAARGRNGVHQAEVLAEGVAPEGVEVDVAPLRVERVVDFGASWWGLPLVTQLGLRPVLDTLLATGREEIPWSAMTMLLVVLRLVDPSSELRIAEHLFERTALSDLLGIPSAKVNDDRLSRALDQVLPPKDALEGPLKERLGQLFKLTYDPLLDDITSTYFAGACAENEEARFGYSRDQRSDWKQICSGLVGSREGMPLGDELFAGNRAAGTTVPEIVEKIAGKYGKAERIWVMDRGMVSEKTLTLLRTEDRHDIVGTPRGLLRQFAGHWVNAAGWQTVADGLMAKLIAAEEGKEWFIRRRGEARGGKEKAMLARFEERIEAGLKKLAAACTGKKKLRPTTIERRVGALLSRNSRAKGLFTVQVSLRDDGGTKVVWEKQDKPAQWASLTEGCYLLRTNVAGTVGEIWPSSIPLTEAEAAFRIAKSDVRLRPIWHQKDERVKAHVLVCFLADVLWKTLGQLCKRAGLGEEPRKVSDELGGIKMVDVLRPTRGGIALRRRCISQPTKAHAILLDRLQLRLPAAARMQPTVV